MWMTVLQEWSWWCPMCGWHGWGMMWMWVFWLVIIAAAAVVMTALLRRRTPDDRSTPPRSLEAPADTLRRRYAAGEIDRETYRQMLEDLGEPNP